MCAGVRVEGVFSPERGATVDQGDGSGHVTVFAVKHSRLQPFMEHLHFSLETEDEGTDERQGPGGADVPPPHHHHPTLPVQEVSQTVQAALSHPGAEAAADGGRTVQVHLHRLRRHTPEQL